MWLVASIVCVSVSLFFLISLQTQLCRCYVFRSWNLVIRSIDWFQKDYVLRRSWDCPSVVQLVTSILFFPGHRSWVIPVKFLVFHFDSLVCMFFLHLMLFLFFHETFFDSCLYFWSLSLEAGVIKVCKMYYVFCHLSTAAFCAFILAIQLVPSLIFIPSK